MIRDLFSLGLAIVVVLLIWPMFPAISFARQLGADREVEEWAAVAACAPWWLWIWSKTGLFALFFGSFAASSSPPPSIAARPASQVALTSWYGAAYHGRLAANGERFNMHALTAAHKTLPFDTWVEIGKAPRWVVVRITDRLPASSGRTFDLSRGAAERLGIVDEGVAVLEWRTIGCQPASQKTR